MPGYEHVGSKPGPKFNMMRANEGNMLQIADTVNQA